MAAAAAGGAAAQDAEPLDRIVVTGEKTDRSLQDTPTSVRVITAEVIEEHNLTDLEDVIDMTANVTGGDAGFQIRGIDVFRVSGAGSGFLASIYVDGAVLPYRAVQSGPLNVWDVGQVEVLRGPQSTLQGRNALAGAIVIRSQDPTDTFDAKARARVTAHDGYNGAVAFGGPIGDGQLSYRIAGEHSEFGGFVDNTFLGTDLDFDERSMLRGKLAFEPDALPGFAALLTLTHDDHEFGPSTSFFGPSMYDDRTVAWDVDIFESITTDIATLELSYDLNDTWSLEAVTSYNEADYEYLYENDYTTEPLGSVWDIQDGKTFTQELRAHVSAERFNGLVGLYYSDFEEVEMYGGTNLISFEATGIPTLLAAPPEFGGFGLPPAVVDAVRGIYAPADPFVLTTDVNSPDTVTTTALFFDGSYALSDQLTIFGGGRFDHEEQESLFSNIVTPQNLDQLPDPASPFFDPDTAFLIGAINAQLIAAVEAASGVGQPTSAEFDAFLPKLGATYDWTDDLSTSFTVQRGYRSGGSGSNIARATTFSYDQEFTWNYDFAVRSQWLDGRLTANANVFYIDWTDQQVALQLSSNDFDTEVGNAGSSHLYGAEFEVFYAPTDGLDAYASVGYVKTEFDEFFYLTAEGETVDLSGRAFPYSPEWTASVGATYRTAHGYFVQGSANHQGDSLAYANPFVFTDIDPRDDARTVVNAAVGYEGDQFSLRLFAENLLDEEYVTFPNNGTNNRVTLGDPRVLGVRLDVAY